MTVVADTSPLNYLVQIGEVDLLPDLFERVVIPQAVFHELNHPKTSSSVRLWVGSLPAWVEVHSVEGLTHAALLGLDIGSAKRLNSLSIRESAHS